MNTSLNDNFLVGFILNTLDANRIYEGMFYLSSMAAFAPWLVVIFSTIRVLQEATDAISMKAAVAEAIAAMGQSVYMYLIYTSVGLFLIGIIFTFTQLFEQFGSTQLIHSSLIELRNVLINSEEKTSNWFMSLLEGTGDALNLPIAGITWTAYQLLSPFYVFFNQLIDILFAVGFVVVYIWGFIAIGTVALKDDMNLMKGFKLSLFTLAIWAILEPILLGVLWLSTQGAVEWLTETYAGYGFGTTSITFWYLYSILTMFMVILIKVLCPFLAYMLAQNQSIGGALGGAAAAVATVGLNQILQKTMGKDSVLRQALQSAMPNSEGSRGRDSFAQGVSDIANAPVSDLARSVKSGIGNLVSENGASNSSGAEASTETNTNTESNNMAGDDSAVNNESSQSTDTGSNNMASNDSPVNPESSTHDGHNNDLSAHPSQESTASEYESMMADTSSTDQPYGSSPADNDYSSNDLKTPKDQG